MDKPKIDKASKLQQHRKKEKIMLNLFQSPPRGCLWLDVGGQALKLHHFIQSFLRVMQHVHTSTHHTEFGSYVRISTKCIYAALLIWSKQNSKKHGKEHGRQYSWSCDTPEHLQKSKRNRIEDEFLSDSPLVFTLAPLVPVAKCGERGTRTW